MKLTPQQLARLSELVNLAMDLSDGERTSWLADLDEADVEVRRAVVETFSHDGRAPDFTLALPRMSASRGAHPIASDAAQSVNPVTPGERLGAWRIERLLGTGGMGQVWLALRDDGRYDGRAAVKLVRGFASDATRRRFETEGKLLARLEHPNIARLLDAGERDNADGSESGAYLMLEYVDGAPIDVWADARRLSVPERLKLFLQICAALSYAHGNLVVHRDIKPSNILVQDNGQIKLLDFGVAKLIEEESASTSGGSELTMEAGVALTPEYASPEQIDSRPISVASDVYSLGVLLFRLLAGVRPYDVAQPTRLALVRAILDEAPRRLSTASHTLARDASSDNADVDASVAVGAAGIDPKHIAELRGTTPERLQRALSGDLDTILATALKKLPNERYATVQAFADDIQRHLNHQPILARADSLTYRARKFARRNWVPLVAAVAVAAATAGGVVSTLWQAGQVKSEAERANAIKDFLIGVFSANDTRIASDKPRGQMTARELLDVSAEKIEKDFAAYPETQHDLLGYFAEIYGGLSEDKRYDALRDRQRELIEKHYAPLSVQAIEWSLNRINRICGGDLAPECDQLLASVDDQIKRAGRDDSTLRAEWFRYQGLHFGKKTMMERERKAALQSAIALFEKHAPRSMRLVDTLADLATAYTDVLEYEKAIETQRRALRVSESVTAPAANRVATIYSNLAHDLSSTHRYDEAIDALRAAANLLQKTVGPTHYTSWFAQGQLAQVYQRTGRRAEARQVFTELLTVLPPASEQHYNADRARSLYAGTLISEGQTAEAVTVLEEIQRHALSSAGNTDYVFLLRQVRWSLGAAYFSVGRHDDAKRALKTALDDTLTQEKPDSQLVLAFRESYGNLLFECGDIDGAATQFSEIAAQARNRKLSHIALGHGGLARVAAKRGQTEIALVESEKALDTWAKREGVSTVRMEPRLHRMRADALAASGRIDEAQAMEDAAWRASLKFDGPANPTTVRRVMKKG